MRRIPKKFFFWKALRDHLQCCTTKCNDSSKVRRFLCSGAVAAYFFYPHTVDNYFFKMQNTTVERPSGIPSGNFFPPYCRWLSFFERKKTEYRRGGVPDTIQVCSVSAVYLRQLAFFNIPSQEIRFPFIPNSLSFLAFCRGYGGIWACHLEARGCPVTPWRRRQTAPPIWLSYDNITTWAYDRWIIWW